MNTKLVTALAVFCFIAVMALPAVQADTGSDAGYQSQLDANGQKVYQDVGDRFESEIGSGSPHNTLQFLISFPDPMLFQDEDQAVAYATDVVNSALAAIYYTDAEAVWLWDLPIKAVEVTVTCAEVEVSYPNSDKDSGTYVMPASVRFTVDVPTDMADDPSTMEENELYTRITELRDARFEVEGSVSEKVKAIADRLHSITVVDNVIVETPEETPEENPDNPGETPSEETPGDTADDSSEETGEPQESQVGNVYDALVTGSSSTEGIAAAFTYLCQYNGVDALTVRGTVVTSSNPDENGTGCWNIVRNDDEAGTWYGVSVTDYDGDDRSPLMAGASTEIGVSGPGFSSVYVANLDLASENSLNPIQISATGFDWPDDRTFFEKYGTHVFAVILVAIIAGVIVYALRTGNV